MKKISKSLIELIGNTPLLQIEKYSKSKNLATNLIVKIESFNPAGSVKDRTALAMINAAEQSGKLLAGGTIIEPTSGNTGIGIAMVAAIKGHKVILTMPNSMSIERQKLLKAYGAEIVLTPGAQGMKGAISKAEELQKSTPNSIILQQFSNPANAEIHERTTAQEIWNDTEGNVDIFVAGVGTGGTISGVGKGLKNHKSDIQIIAVEPQDSPILSGGQAGPHKIQGIGAGFVPQNYHAEVVDKILQVSNDDAMQTARELATTEGLLVGISSGAAIFAASQIATQPKNKDKNIVVLLPDTGTRYLSTNLFCANPHAI